MHMLSKNLSGYFLTFASKSSQSSGYLAIRLLFGKLKWFKIFNFHKDPSQSGMLFFQTFCCVVKVEESACDEFIQTFHHKRWSPGPNSAGEDFAIGGHHVAVVVRTKINGNR